MKRWIITATLAVAIAIPLLAFAQDVTGDPMLDSLMKYVPAKALPYVAGLWIVLFYLVAPIVKAKVGGSSLVGRLAVKAAEWITQDSHRPPPLKVVKGGAESPPKGAVSTAVAILVAVTCTLVLVFVTLLPSRAFGQDRAEMEALERRVLSLESCYQQPDAAAVARCFDRGINGRILVAQADTSAAAPAPEVAPAAAPAESAPPPAAPPAETPAPAAPAPRLEVRVTSDLSLHPNVSIAAFGYDITHRQWIGGVQITGLYVLTSKRLLDAGIGFGGSLKLGTGATGTDTGLSGTLNGTIVSPRLAAGGVNLHAAVIGGRQFGPVAAWLAYVAPTVEF
jgi:hypothetical protein